MPPKMEKRTGGTEGEPRWSKPLLPLARQFSEWANETEKGSMSWPMIENVAALKKGELEEFIQYWKERGVYIETHGDGGPGNLSLKATNSEKPIIIDGGGWFSVWSERIETIRNDALVALERRYPEHEGLQRLTGLGFNPGVWFGPDYEPRYFSPQARDVIIKNAAKIEKLIDIATVTPSRNLESIAAQAIPAVFISLGDNLTEQHINILLEGISGLPADVRDEALAYALPAVIRAKSPEQSTPALLIETCRMLNLITLGIPPDNHREITPKEFAKLKERLGVLGRGLTMPDTSGQRRGQVMKYVGEFIEATGKRYSPQYLRRLVGHFDLAPKDIELLISNFGGAFFTRTQEPISPADFEKCLSLTRRITEKVSPGQAAELVRSDIPHLLKDSKTEGRSTVELYEKIISDLEYVVSNSQIPGSVLHTVGGWSWRIPYEAREQLPLDDMRSVIEKLLEIEKATDAESAKSIHDAVLSPILWARDHYIRDGKQNKRNNEYMSPELLGEYVSEIWKTTPRKLKKFLSMDATDLRHLLDESMNAMSPEVLKRYIDLMGISTVSAIKTASKIWESADKDIDPSIVDQALLIAGRINSAVAKIGSKIPLDALDDVTGRRGMGNDDKPGVETLVLAEGYAVFLENHVERIKELCPPLLGPDTYERSKAGWDQEAAVLKEFTLRHNGKVTTSTGWRVSEWKKEEAAAKRRGRRK
jgi:hypothetical protein